MVRAHLTIVPQGKPSAELRGTSLDARSGRLHYTRGRPEPAEAMTTDDPRCSEARKFQRIDDAFRAGDLDALRAAVDDPALVPHGLMPLTIGSCLVYAIYHSPLAFIRTLLEIGADPNAPVDDGFPPLIAALCARDVPGSTGALTWTTSSAAAVVRSRSEPARYQRLHAAPHGGRRAQLRRAVPDPARGGADPTLRTRIDDCTRRGNGEGGRACRTSPRCSTSHAARAGSAVRSTCRSRTPGRGEPVRRQRNYRIRLRLWLNQGEPVRWMTAWGPVGVARLEDDGETLVTEIRVNRRSLVNGLFYGVDGMRVGGTRRLEIAPHLAYGERGVPGVIPPNAVLTPRSRSSNRPRPEPDLQYSI